MQETGLYDTYQTTVKHVASRINHRPNEADINGFTFSDYAGELALLSIEAQSSFREQNGFFPDRERRYVRGALYTRGSHLRRELARTRQSAKCLDTEEPPELLKSRIEGQLEARNALHVLRARLGEHDFSILRRVAEAGSGRKALTDDDGSQAHFARRVRRLREMARKILDESTTQNSVGCN